MNLLFSILKITSSFLSYMLSSIVILSALIYFYPQVFPYTELTTSDFESYISNTNRIVIFILGTTVSANIYLYTTRNKISSSIMWSSNQIKIMAWTIGVNLIILFIGNYLTNYEFIFNKTLSFETVKLLLYSYLVLGILSVILFVGTFIKFVTGFKINQNMSKMLKKIDRSMYPMSINKLLDEEQQIIKYSKNTLKRFIEKRISNTVFAKVNIKITTESKLLKLLANLLHFYIIAFISLFTLLKILFTRKNSVLVRTRAFSKKEIETLNLEIEIYCQNLEYVIEQNSNKSMNEHFRDWNATFSRLIVMLFHIKSFEKESETISKLYKDLLHHHSKLIIATSKSYEHQTYYKQLLVSLFKGLAYKEEAYFNVSTEIFDKRNTEFEEIYFNELFLLFTSLLKEDEYEFFGLLQTDGLSINSFMNTKKENEKYFGDKSRKERFENLFLSIFIKMIELNHIDNLSTVIAILLSLREEEKSQSSSKDILTPTKQMKITRNETSHPVNYNLSHKIKLGLYYAAIKANELENYKAAGYIIKILSSNLTHASLTKLMIDIHKERNRSRNILYDAGIYKVDFNDYSYKYCVEKTFVLINTQFFLKNDFLLTDELKSVFKEINISYFIRKLGMKEKEYNMIALNEENLTGFVETLKKYL